MIGDEENIHRHYYVFCIETFKHVSRRTDKKQTAMKYKLSTDKGYLIGRLNIRKKTIYQSERICRKEKRIANTVFLDLLFFKKWNLSLLAE